MKQHEKNNHRHFGSVTIIPWIWVEHQQICHGFSPISKGWVPSAASASAWSAAP